jgi:hypothetical protein
VQWVSDINGDPSYQQWTMKVYLDKNAICGPIPAQQATLDFTIVSAIPAMPVSPGHGELSLTIELENWCGTNTTVEMEATQATYFDAAFTMMSNRFLVDSRVHMAVTVTADYSLQVSNVVLDSVTVTGPALISGTSLTIFDAITTPAPGVFLTQTPISCQGIALANRMCYSFFLQPGYFQEQKTMTIESVVTADLVATKKRTEQLVGRNTPYDDATALSRIIIDSRRGTMPVQDGATYNKNINVMPLSSAFLAAIAMLVGIAALALGAALYVVLKQRTRATANV